MKSFFLLVCLTGILALNSCEQSTESQPNRPPAKPLGAGSAPTDSSGQPSRIPDAIDYASLGIPATNREWSPSDYVNAYKIIKGVPSASLPRLGMPSGVYERMASTENLNLIRNTNLPLEQRLQAGLGYLEAIPQVMSVYVTVPYQNRELRDESLGLMELSFTSYNMVIPLVEEFMTTLSPEEQKNPVRHQGRKTMVQGMEQSLAGLLTCLGEYDVWTAKHRVRFAQILQSVLVQNWQILTPEFKKEVAIRLKERLGTESDIGAKAAIASLLDAVSRV